VPRAKLAHRIDVLPSRLRADRFRWVCSCGSRGLTLHAYPGHAEAAALHHLKAWGVR